MKLYVDDKNDSRIELAQKLQKPDKVPVSFSDQLDFLSGWLGLECDIYHVNAELMLDAQIKFNQRFRGTGIIGPNYGVIMEPSAFGAKVLFKNNRPPWVLQLCNDVDEIVDFTKNLEDPDPLSAGCMPLFYQTYFYMRKLTQGEISPPLGAIATIDVAALLVGFDNLCLAMKLYPETAHALMTKINNFLIKYIELKIKLFGVKNVDLIDLYGDYAAYMSETDFREFVLPYNKKIYDYFSNETTVKLFHSDGPLRHLKQGIIDMGCTCLYSFDPTVDLEEYVKEMGDHICLMGNLDPIRILRNGTEDEVYNEAKRLLEIGKQAKGFVLTTGGELPNGTPPENIDAVFRAVDDFGVY